MSDPSDAMAPPVLTFDGAPVSVTRIGVPVAVGSGVAVAVGVRVMVGVAVAIAGIFLGAVSGPHIAAGLEITGYPWLLSGTYLAFSLLFSSVCLLIAYLPFLANLNSPLRIREESLASERQRLRREVHDNVAQTLAFLSLKMRQAEERASSPSNVLTSADVKDISSAVERAYLTVRDYLDGTQDSEIDPPLSPGLSNMIDQ